MKEKRINMIFDILVKCVNQKEAGRSNFINQLNQISYTRWFIQGTNYVYWLDSNKVEVFEFVLNDGELKKLENIAKNVTKELKNIDRKLKLENITKY